MVLDITWKLQSFGVTLLNIRDNIGFLFSILIPFFFHSYLLKNFHVWFGMVGTAVAAWYGLVWYGVMLCGIVRLYLVYVYCMVRLGLVVTRCQAGALFASVKK